MTAPIADDKLAEIKAALARGRKIDAIKLYRRITGAGLAEAKAAVETLEGKSGSTSPQESRPPSGGRGCLGVVLAAWLAAR
jgi:ribosomal protein L7/L12